MKQAVLLAALLVSAAGLAGCAQSVCSQPDVLAFVDKTRQSHDIYAIGVTSGTVRESPILLRQTDLVDRHRVLCSAPLISRNPAYQPGNGQASNVRTQQSFWVAKLASGYEVGIYRN